MAHKPNLLVGLMRNHFQTYRKIPALSHLWVLEDGGFHEVLRWDFPSISGDIFRVVSNGCEGPNLAFLVVLLWVWNVVPKWKTTVLKTCLCRFENTLFESMIFLFWHTFAGYMQKLSPGSEWYFCWKGQICGRVWISSENLKSATKRSPNQNLKYQKPFFSCSEFPTNSSANYPKDITNLEPQLF